RMYSQLGQRAMTGQGGQADQGQGAPSVGRTGGIQNGPQDAVAGTAGPAPPPFLAYNGDPSLSGVPAPASTANYAGTSAPGYMPSPQTAMAMEYLKLAQGQNGDPLGAVEKVQQYTRQQNQIAWANDSSIQGEAFTRQMATSPDAGTILQRNIQQLGP